MKKIKYSSYNFTMKKKKINLVIREKKKVSMFDKKISEIKHKSCLGWTNLGSYSKNNKKLNE